MLICKKKSIKDYVVIFPLDLKLNVIPFYLSNTFRSYIAFTPVFSFYFISPFTPYLSIRKNCTVVINVVIIYKRKQDKVHQGLCCV